MPIHWRQLAVSAAALMVVGIALAAVLLSPGSRTRLDIAVRSYLTDAGALVVGDSIAFEAAPSELCGTKVFNAAFPGYQVRHLLREAGGYARRIPARTVVIAVGVNDAWAPAPNLDDWARDYDALVALYAKRAKVLLVEINPADPSLVFNGRRMDTTFIAAANVAIREIAERTGAQIVRAPRLTSTRDGLHPDAAGAQAWRERLAAVACAKTPPA